MSLKDKINQIKEFTGPANQTFTQQLEICREELGEAENALWWYYDEHSNEDRVKEICDVLFTILPLLDHLVTDPDAAFNRVCQSNMSKLWDQDGKPVMVKNDKGKIVKGPNYKPPCFKDLMK